MPNVYYSPDECGLEIIGSLDEPDLSYEFHTLLVWRDAEGRLYYKADSG